MGGIFLTRKCVLQKLLRVRGFCSRVVKVSSSVFSRLSALSESLVQPTGEYVCRKCLPTSTEEIYWGLNQLSTAGVTDDEKDSLKKDSLRNVLENLCERFQDPDRKRLWQTSHRNVGIMICLNGNISCFNLTFYKQGHPFSLSDYSILNSVKYIITWLRCHEMFCAHV